jgi:cytochrome c oxidase cbb3-type subunit 1
MHPYYAMRAVGGGIFLLGAVIMLFNVLMTVRKSVSDGSLRDARGTPAAAAA